LAPFIDFAAIREAISIEKAAEFVGLPATAKDQIRCACPACETTDDRALVVTKSAGKYYCFAEKRGGDAIGLVAHIKGIGQREAAQLIQRELLRNSAVPDNPTVRHSTSTSRRRPVQEHKQPPAAIGLTPLEYLEHDHEAVEALGLSAEDAEALGIGYAPKGIMRGLIAVPIRLPDGKLAGYIGIEEARLPSRWHHINVVPLRKRAS